MFVITFWLFRWNLSVAIFLFAFTLYFRLNIFITNHANCKFAEKFSGFNLYFGALMIFFGFLGIIFNFSVILKLNVYSIISWPMFIAGLVLAAFSILADSSISVRRFRCE